MSSPRPAAPDARLIEGLLVERYPERGVSVRVEYPDSSRGPRILITVDRAKTKHRPLERYLLEVQHLEGGDEDALWDLVVDAADALFGSLIESGFAYRDLPAGDGIEYHDAKLEVRISHTRPDIEAQADQLLGQVGED